MVAGEPMRRGHVMRVLILGAALVAAVASAPAARAQQSDELRLCSAAAGASPDQTRASCTSVSGPVQSGNPVASGPSQPSGQPVGSASAIQTPSPPAKSALDLYNQGSVHLRGKEYDLAIADLDAAIKLNPKYVFALNARGLAYESKGQHDLAIADYDHAIELDAKQAVAFFNRGTAYRNKGRYDSAIADFNRALAINPNYAVAFFGRALAYQNKAQWDFDAYLDEGRYEALAVADYDAGIRLNPKNGAAFNNRALILVTLHQYDRAIKDYNEAILIEPTNGLYIKNRGNAFRITGRYAQAIADYRKALTLKIDDPVKKQIETALKELGISG
jgi:tetratricopeptide (TPR) repeat protein